MKLERKVARVARWDEVSLLAFDPASGSDGLVDLSAAAEIKLVQLVSRSWMPRLR